MNVLLDTCALLWWWGEPEQMSNHALALVKDPSNRVFVSPATAWEVATKHRNGKLPLAGPMLEDWQLRMARDGFAELPITMTEALRAGSFSNDHKDPFDRMIAAQALERGFAVLSSDSKLAALGAEVLW